MRVLIVGVLDVPWSTNVSMKHALEKSGHFVEAFNYRTVEAQYKKSCFITNTFVDKWLDKAFSFLRSARLPFNSTLYYRRSGRKKMNQLLLDTVKKNSLDLVLFSKTDTVDYTILPEVNKNAPTWYFFMDPVDQAVRINAGAYASRATWASATFSDVADYFRKAGADAHWITQGVDVSIFCPKNVPKVYDIVFVGTKTSKRSLYISALRNAGISVTCFGEGWENKPVYQDELVDIYQKSRIVLNFCRSGKGFSIRVFQVMGAGTFLLSEHCTDLEQFFKKAEHLDMFASEDEMIRKAKTYLKDDSRRESIARNGCNLVYQEYSWEVIMKKIIELSLKKKNKKL